MHRQVDKIDTRFGNYIFSPIYFCFLLCKIDQSILRIQQKEKQEINTTYKEF